MAKAKDKVTADDKVVVTMTAVDPKSDRTTKPAVTEAKTKAARVDLVAKRTGDDRCRDQKTQRFQRV